MGNKQARVIAFYLPQFHPIPENDLWWGKGFTEWTNVGKAKSRFWGHYQPHVPADLGYYDLRVPEVREAQAQLAKEYGVEGFCYWHYWFGNGKRLLERPFNEVLASGKPDFPFCLAWANESWKGIHHGLKNRKVLIEQRYPGEEDYIAHFYEVLPAFKDERYIRVDGKPLFMIYKPLDNKKEILSFMGVWQRLAEENGLPGIFFVGQTYAYDKQSEEIRGMGFSAINTVRMYDYERKEKFASFFSKRLHSILRRPYVIPYRLASKWFVSDVEAKEDVYPTVLPNWDHTPRSGIYGLVMKDAEPEYFDLHMKMAMRCVAEKADEHRIIFVKSWNEWAEGNYLEPDMKYGLKYLEVISKHVMKK